MIIILIIIIIIISSSSVVEPACGAVRPSKTSTKMQMSFFRLGNYGAVEAKTLTERTG